jgi:hypothetical protein
MIKLAKIMSKLLKIMFNCGLTMPILALDYAKFSKNCAQIVLNYAQTVLNYAQNSFIILFHAGPSSLGGSIAGSSSEADLDCQMDGAATRLRPQGLQPQDPKQVGQDPKQVGFLLPHYPKNI